MHHLNTQNTQTANGHFCCIKIYSLNRESECDFFFFLREKQNPFSLLRKSQQQNSPRINGKLSAGCILRSRVRYAQPLWRNKSQISVGCTKIISIKAPSLSLWLFFLSKHDTDVWACAVSFTVTTLGPAEFRKQETDLLSSRRSFWTKKLLCMQILSSQLSRQLAILLKVNYLGL